MTRRGGRRSPLAAVALAALLVLAGCSGTIGGPLGGDATETATLTPVDVPGEQRAAGTGETRSVGGRPLAPGLRTGGVRDPLALAAAHRDRLEKRSFTRTDSLTLVDSNGTLLASRMELRVRPGGTPFRIRRGGVAAPRYEGSPPADVTVYHDGIRAASRVVENGSVRYYAEDSVPPAAVASDRTGRDAVAGLLTAFAWEVTRVEIAGEPHYQLDSTGLRDRDALAAATGMDGSRGATARLLVGPDGQVQRYRLQYEATIGDDGVAVTETARWSAVGGTAVEQPEWFARALGRRSGSGGPATVTDTGAGTTATATGTTTE